MIDLDQDHLVEMASRILTRPDSYLAWDDRWYTTHGCVYAWADRSDDLVAESNFHTMLAALEGAVAHDESGASEDRGDDVVDTSASHWAYGSVRELMVRVYVDADDPDQGFTPAFIEAVACLDALEQQALLDESDYSEREYAAWERTVELAIHDAAQEHYEDSELDQDCIKVRVYASEDLECTSPDDVRWDKVKAIYDRHRNAFFDWQAQRYLPFYWPEMIPPYNQLWFEGV